MGNPSLGCNWDGLKATMKKHFKCNTCTCITILGQHLGLYILKSGPILGRSTVLVNFEPWLMWLAQKYLLPHLKGKAHGGWYLDAPIF